MAPSIPRAASFSPITRRVCLAFLIASLALIASCAPPWMIIRQAAPNPFAGNPAFALMPVLFEGLTVDSSHPIPEEQYLARKSPEQQAAWQTDKANLAQHFFLSVAEHSQGLQIMPATPGSAVSAPFAVHTHVAMIEPGSYFRQPECHMHVQITNAQGQVLDEVVLRVQPNMGVVFPVSLKLQAMGDMLGEALTRYLRERMHPT